MKQIAFLTVLVAIIISGCTSDSKKCERLLKKSDTTIVSAYVNGFDYEGQIKKKADHIAANNLSRSHLHYQYFDNTDSKTLRLYLLALEKSRGAKNAALYIYEEHQFNYHFYLAESAIEWNNRVALFEQAGSPALLQELEHIVLERSEDPFWLKRFMAEDEFLKLCLSKALSDRILVAFYAYLNDSDQRRFIKIVDVISDGWIINYREESPYFKERIIKICKRLDFLGAYRYLGDVGAIKERNSLIMNKGIENLNSQEIIMCAGNKCFPVSQARKMLKHKSTRELASLWLYDFPQDEYIELLAQSVKNFDDLKLAKQTIENLDCVDYDIWADSPSDVYWTKMKNQ